LAILILLAATAAFPQWGSSNARRINGRAVCATAPSLGEALVFNGTQWCPAATSGSGDVLGQASSVDGEIALFSGTGGTTIKRATGTRLAHVTSGVFGTATISAPLSLSGGTLSLPAAATAQNGYLSSTDWNRFDLLETQVKVASVTVSSADILSLHTTGKEVIAAPGAGKFIRVIAAVYSLDYNSAAYSGSGHVRLHYQASTYNTALADDANCSWRDPAATLLLTQTADRVIACTNAGTIGYTATASDYLNKGVYLLASGAYTAGNSPVRARVFYLIVDTGL